MKEKDDIVKLSEKIRRSNKRGSIFAPFGIAFFIFTTWLNFNKAINHMGMIADASISESASADTVRMRVLTDCIPVIGSFILIAISLAALAIIVFMFVVPNNDRKLLLAIASKVGKMDKKEAVSENEGLKRENEANM